MKSLSTQRRLFYALALGWAMGLLSSSVTSGEMSKDSPNANESAVTPKNESSLGKEYKSCIEKAAQTAPLSGEAFQSCERLLPDTECKGESCGELGKMEFSAVIAVYVGKIRDCYNHELSTNKNAHGRMATHFSVNKEGRVEDLVLERNDLSAEMGACLVAASHQWLFPKKSGRTESIRYPFILNPK